MDSHGSLFSLRSFMYPLKLSDLWISTWVSKPGPPACCEVTIRETHRLLDIRLLPKESLCTLKSAFHHLSWDTMILDCLWSASSGSFIRTADEVDGLKKKPAFRQAFRISLATARLLPKSHERASVKSLQSAVTNRTAHITGRLSKSSLSS